MEVLTLPRSSGGTPGRNLDCNLCPGNTGAHVDESFNLASSTPCSNQESYPSLD